MMTKLALATAVATLSLFASFARADGRPNLRPGDIGYDRETGDLSLEVINDGETSVEIETIMFVTINGGSTLQVTVAPFGSSPSQVITLPGLGLTDGAVTVNVDATGRVIEANETDNIRTGNVIP